MDISKCVESTLLINYIFKYSLQSQENMTVFKQSELKGYPQLFS
jgi:hypothetical protein